MNEKKFKFKELLSPLTMEIPINSYLQLHEEEKKQRMKKHLNTNIFAKKGKRNENK